MPCGGHCSWHALTVALGARAEIGATARSPAMVTMKYGIMMGYVTILGAYITVSITGEGPSCAKPGHAGGVLETGVYTGLISGRMRYCV